MNVKQKSLVKLCYSLITAIDKEFDLTDYMTKPPQTAKSQSARYFSFGAFQKRTIDILIDLI